MAKGARVTRTIPRGDRHRRANWWTAVDREHYYKCEACGGWFDMRDLGSVLDHEEPPSHPASDRVQ
jgi:hypothetical protein